MVLYSPVLEFQTIVKTWVLGTKLSGSLEEQEEFSSPALQLIFKTWSHIGPGWHWTSVYNSCVLTLQVLELQVVWPHIVYGVLGLGLWFHACQSSNLPMELHTSPVPMPFYIDRLFLGTISHVQRSDDDWQEIKFRLPGLTVSTFTHWDTLMVPPASYLCSLVAMWPSPSWNSLSCLCLLGLYSHSGNPFSNPLCFLDVVAHAFCLSPQETDAGYLWVWGQPGYIVCRQNLFLTKQNKTQNSCA